MPVEVFFCANVGNNSCAAERDLLDDLESFRTRLISRGDHEGALVITVEGQLEFRIEDELQNAVPFVCFDAVTELAAGRPFVYAYMSMSGVIEFNPEDDAVNLSGDYVPAISAPQAELLLALHACGLRWMEFFRLLHGEGADPILADMQVRADIARHALTRHTA
jgi:hypothetical protein